MTTARLDSQESSASARLVAEVPRAQAPQDKAPRTGGARSRKPAKPPRRGRFHRPELESRWERLSRNRMVQAASGTTLLAGTAVLVVVALGR
ncbi:hypothetical protein [Herbiconiux ginsengi]|uniref:Uncharacterized protein n=1 Tax=Herbiconiux ginsengi TaxID=381665 RepID=A0A1H3LEY2_9MICO|nr:hypothetical protein [Herbiconiux ginsengi]SDY62518.1 hypothetical protein SAMN05216554_0936 [Herbiconiux ginsengi]